MQIACRNYLSYPLIVSCYNVYVFQTVKQSTKDNQSYKQYSNATGRVATGRGNQSESSIAPKQVWWGHNDEGTDNNPKADLDNINAYSKFG